MGLSDGLYGRLHLPVGRWYFYCSIAYKRVIIVTDKTAFSKVQFVTVSDQDDDIRVDRWFKRHVPDLSYIQLEKLLRKGEIRVDKKRVKANTRLVEGQEVKIPPLKLQPSDKSAEPKAKKPAYSDKEMQELRNAVLFMDDHVIALNKPAGLAVQGGSGQKKHLDGMLDGLKFKAAERPKLVHRLDKDTSGVILLARTPKAATALTKAFKSRDIRKEYWAVTRWVPNPEQGIINARLQKEGGNGYEKMVAHKYEGQPAQTIYTVLERAQNKLAWVALWPKTGRTHQLRAHLAFMERPILGDGKYGGQDAYVQNEEVSKKMHLHAHRLQLPHPILKGRRLDVKAPLPKHMEPVWDMFGWDKEIDFDPFEQFED